MPVVLMLSLTMIGMPSSGRRSPWRARRVGRASVVERRRADGDDGVKHRVERTDPVQVELGQLHGGEAMPVHQRWSSGIVVASTSIPATRVSVGSSAKPLGFAAPDTAGTECEKGRENERSQKTSSHRAGPPRKAGGPVSRDAEGEGRPSIGAEKTDSAALTDVERNLAPEHQNVNQRLLTGPVWNGQAHSGLTGEHGGVVLAPPRGDAMSSRKPESKSSDPEATYREPRFVLEDASRSDAGEDQTPAGLAAGPAGAADRR